MKGYGEYKKTTYDWLPSIPVHWEHTTIRALMQLSDIRCGVRSDLEFLSVYRDYGVIKKNSRDDNHNKASLDISNYKYVGKNFVVMNKMKMWQGSLGVSTLEGIVSPAYIVCTVRKDLNFRYLNLLLRSHLFKTFYNRISYGIRVGQWDLRYDDLKTLDLFLPPREEQDQIVRYLDAKVGKINKLIRIKQKQIALLKEKKQAIINQAVTKGLDPNAPMKDSGIAWIGQIPEGWEVRRLKQVCAIVDCKNRTPEHVDGGKYIVVRTTCIRDGVFSLVGSYPTDEVNYKIWTQRGAPQQGDVFFTREAPMGEACIVPNMNNICMGQRMMYFRPSNEILSELLILIIYSSICKLYISNVSNGSTVGHLRLGQVGDIPVLWCPVEQQKDILSAIQSKTQKIDLSVKIEETAIATLTEYRTRLISDVVTGKIDVQNIASPSYHVVNNTNEEHIQDIWADFEE